MLIRNTSIFLKKNKLNFDKIYTYCSSSIHIWEGTKTESTGLKLTWCVDIVLFKEIILLHNDWVNK